MIPTLKLLNLQKLNKNKKLELYLPRKPSDFTGESKNKNDLPR